ncbi:MAG: MBL fold metallo-hydrolase [Gaiellales bacterium]
MGACRLEQVTPRVWWFTPDERSDRPSLAAVAGDRGTAVLDAGASRAHAEAFLGALAPLGLPPVVAVVVTHWHWDHSFGACAYDAPVVALRETAAEVARQRALTWDAPSLAARVAAGQELAFCAEMLHVEYPNLAGVEIRVPDAVFDGEHALELGGVTCRVVHVGGDHAADSVVVHVPEEALLFLGDCHYQRLYAEREHYTVVGARRLLGRLRGLAPVEVAIEGHGDGRLDARELTAFLQGLESAADRVDRLGCGALETATDADDEETLALFLAGVE